MGSDQYLNPEKVLDHARDEYEPEQFDPRRCPTIYRIKYRDERWRRVYAKFRGIMYIVYGGQEFRLNTATIDRCAQAPTTTPTYPRPIATEPVAKRTFGECPDDDIPF